MVRGVADVAFTASDHNLRLAFMTSVAIVLSCRLACVAARPLIEPATLFAPLSQMLKNGFFFNHGLRTRCFPFVARRSSLDGKARSHQLLAEFTFARAAS